MPQLIIPINKQVDISKGALMTTLGLMNSGDELIQGDSYAHRLNVVVMDGDAQADLSGQAIAGKFIRSDGSTVTVVGSASGNVASVDFPSFVYAYVGRLVITLSAGGTALTQIYATVKNGSTNVVVDPGNVLPNLDEIQQTMLDVEAALQEIETALAASSAATAAANEGAARANTAAASIENMTAIANTLTPGSQATVEVTTVGDHYVITFGIPQGIQGERGSTTYSGTAITGTSTTPTAYPTGIASAIPGDQYYYNGIASSDIGNVYICTSGGDAQTALWKYDRNNRGAPGAGAVSTVNGVQPTDGNVALTGADIPASGTDATKIDEALAALILKADIANNLTTEDAGKVLSALQGKVLNDALTLKAQYTLLYTNASPGSTFAAQTLALDLSAYDSVLIEYYVNIATLGYLPSIRVAKGRENLMSMTIADGSRYTRNVSVNAAGLTFGDAYLNGQSVSNASNVPLRIFGVKGV